MDKSGEKQVAYYRSKDPISNLTIKIAFKKLTAASIFKDSEDHEQDEVNEQVTAKQKFQLLQKGSSSEQETLVVHFGEKVLSYREAERYRNGDNSEEMDAEESQRRKQLVEAFDKRSPGARRLFTYVDGDGFIEAHKVRPMTTDADEKPSYLSKKMADLKLADPGSQKTIIESPNSIAVQKTNRRGPLIAASPSEEEKEKNHYLKRSGKTFHVMADLTPPGMEHFPENEHILCTVVLNDNGVISITPDFNRQKPSYTVTAESERREVYEYTIENVSKQISSNERLRERKVVDDIYWRHQEYRIKSVGNEFELPLPSVLRLNTFAEIVSAKNFEYDSIYIQYHLDIPPNWWANPNTCQISGVTQRCKSRVGHDQRRLWHFSFPFEFEVFFREELDEESDGVISQWPTLFFEVLSIDSWLRFRTEGYGWTKLPMSPGVQEIECSCWRPFGDSLASDMRRFFVGGSPELEDIAFAGVPTTHETNEPLSKFGFATESTGSVKLRFNTIMQSQLHLNAKRQKSKQISRNLDRMAGHSMHTTVSNVLETFIKTRSKLKSAREGVLQ